MERVCGNPRCEFNKIEVTSKSQPDYVRLIYRNEVKDMHRYLYRNLKSKLEWYFCESCHAAAQMVDRTD